MNVLEADVHGTNIDAQVFEFGEKVVEVMRREGKLRGLYILHGEGEVGAGEGICEGDCGRCDRFGGGLRLAIFITLPLELQRVC